MSTRHGHARKGQISAEYRAWQAMVRRCCNPATKDYPDYGGRGITVCARWCRFEAFLEDMGPRPSRRHSIDRIDPDGSYSPGNCRWATAREQARNTRRNRLLTHDGKTLCLAEWEEVTGINQGTLRSRIRLGWTAERILTTPDDDRPHLVTFRGRSQSIRDWAAEVGIPYQCLKQRIGKLGWDAERALTTPLLR